MAKEIFEGAIRDLESIAYKGRLFFHLYNEPLAEPETLLDRMRYARRRLQRSIFSITTNGDYLSRKLFEELQDAGCDNISVSIYGPGQGQWEDNYIRNAVGLTARRLGLDATMIEKPGQSFSIAGRIGQVSLNIAGRNLWETGYDRGGLVPELAAHRSSPCLSPFSDVNVDFRGYVLPCCNVYTDRESHKAYTFGNLADMDIFSAYASTVAQTWREKLLNFDPGGSLCGNCSRGNYPSLDTQQNRDTLASLRDSMDIGQAN
jgi:MoaA/NifB/PqqE/SkfB family radical SAM enzyme